MELVLQSIENLRSMSEDREIIIFGAGEYTIRFLNTFYDIVEKVSTIIISDTTDKTEKLYGIPVKNVAVLNQMDPAKIIVVIAMKDKISVAYKKIKEINDFTIFTARILLNPILGEAQHELFYAGTEINKVEDLLFDSTSKKIYKEVIKRRMLYGDDDFRDLIIPGDAEYLLPVLYQNEGPNDEVVLDCGAARGDTLNKFVDVLAKRLKKVYCFECLDSSLEELRKQVGYIGMRDYVPEIHIMPYALSNNPGKLSFAKNDSPLASFLIDNRENATKDYSEYKLNYTEVDVDTIDNLIPISERVSFIKMDIEGSEYEALLGAECTIKTHKPRLAISIYHSGKDYYRIPLLVKQFVPEYKIAIRHHNKNHWDTDMYCWI